MYASGRSVHPTAAMPTWEPHSARSAYPTAGMAIWGDPATVPDVSYASPPFVEPHVASHPVLSSSAFGFQAGNLSRHVSVTAPAIEPAGPSDADFAPKSMDERFQSILAKRNRQVRATEAAVRQTAARQARIASQRQITVEDVHAVANMAPDFPPRFMAHVSVAGAAGSHQPTDPFLDDSFVGYRGRTSESAEDEEEEMEDATIDDYKKSDSRGVTKGKHATLAPGGSSNPTPHTFDPTGRRSANHSIPLAKTPSASAAKAAAAAALAGGRVKKNSQAVTDQITDRGRDSGRHKSTQSSPPPHSRSADRSRRSPKPTASLAGRVERPGSGKAVPGAVLDKSVPAKRVPVKSRLRVPVHMRLSFEGSESNSSRAAAAAAGTAPAAATGVPAAEAPLHLVPTAGILSLPHATPLVPGANLGGLMTAFHPSLTSPFVAAPTGPLLPNPVLFRTIPVSVGGLVGGLVSPDPRYRFGAGRVGVGGQGGGGGREGRGHGSGQGRGSERRNVSVASKAALDDEIESYMAEKYQGKGER
ncbi:unnamed protein product [Closterium sp. NIES-54]